MRASQFFISTLKEAPAEAELISHKLMLRAGLIKRLGSGLYTWMPLGLRVLRKVENIVREEMDKSGAVELLMPAVQPAELWQESGRWDVFGPQMLKIKDRHQRDFCFGPTHEEVITDIARREIKSYRQLPLNLYQIQTKFRDEIRPRFGVMRAREFVMKDAYSFHADVASLEQTYQVMHDTYGRIFTRLGLKFRAVAADPGAIGGSGSHEFHVLADSGEDAIAFCPDSDYAANLELAEALPPAEPREAANKAMQKIATPGKKTCEEVAAFLNVPIEQTVKTLAIVANGEMYLLLLRGDHYLNEVKTGKAPFLAGFRLANEEEILAKIRCRPGYIGPVGLGLPVIADKAVAAMSNFVCGANEADHHLTSVNFGRDTKEPDHIFDIRNVVTDDLSPDGKGKLEICRGIEVGHIFQLRTKYSEAMKAHYLDESGQTQVMEMGCYGIGVSRIVAAAIEQNHDAHGIIFLAAMAPFQMVIVPIGLNKSAQVKTETEKLYEELSAAGIEVLLDDRDERPGIMFADMELIGIPHRIVIGERGLKEGAIEYQGRRDASSQIIPLQNAVNFVRSRICGS
ncbi:MAG: proline--tRNA ligase [Pseudomonadota bacterium]